MSECQHSVKCSFTGQSRLKILSIPSLEISSPLTKSMGSGIFLFGIVAMPYIVYQLECEFGG